MIHDTAWHKKDLLNWVLKPYPSILSISPLETYQSYIKPIAPASDT